MKRIIKCVILLLLIVTIIPSNFSFIRAEEDTDEREIIKLGYYDLEDFMKGASEDEIKTGYAYDLLCEIEAINNWHYEFVYGTFEELLDKLYKNEIDILPCVVYSDERAERILYSDEKITEERYFIYTETANISSDVKIKDLNGKRISTVSGAFQNTIFENWADENGISVEMVYTESFPESWNALIED